jgi:hypothetical protein
MAKTVSWTIDNDAKALRIATAFRRTRGLIDDQTGEPSETLRECTERVMDEVMTRAARKAIREMDALDAAAVPDEDLGTSVGSDL